MTIANLQDVVDAAIGEVSRLRSNLVRIHGIQVQSLEERSIIKGVAWAWFKDHKPRLNNFPADLFHSVDEIYSKLLEAAEHSTSRSRYTIELKKLRSDLIKLRSQLLNVKTIPIDSSDVAPKFAGLISDNRMRLILERRWNETLICINAGANLAAIVMMGGLLEGLLLARILQLPDQGVIYKTKTAPRDKKSGKPLPLKVWGLKHFMDVAHELGWISQAATEIGSVMRDYRNYIHPQKEYSLGDVILTTGDTSMFWQIFKNITRHLVDLNNS